jgi:hypothetical protein
MRATEFLNEHKKGVRAKIYPKRGPEPSKPKKPAAPQVPVGPSPAVKEGVIDMAALAAKARSMLAKGMTEQQVIDQLVREGTPVRYAQQAAAAAQINEEQFCEVCGGSLSEEGKATRALCVSSKPDNQLGASQLASCKSQGLRARDGNKSHKLGKGPESRVKVGGHRIKGKKYGGPLPDWS